MAQIIFATHNDNKVAEVRNILHENWQIITLTEAGLHDAIPEPHHTLEENAREKSTTIYQLTGKNCFSEDTGLEVEALGGQPGVHSARYAGAHATDRQNIDKLLDSMKEERNRDARFRTVISCIMDGEEFVFEGICPGKITLMPRGSVGFGYDPIFVPDGDTRTFAEMTIEEKNQFSHRKKAITRLIEFLEGRSSSRTKQKK